MAITVSGMDLVGEIEYKNGVLDFEGYTSSADSVIDSFSNENWEPQKNGSDTYNPNTKTLQTLTFKSTEGSKFIVTKKGNSEEFNWNMPYSAENSYNISNSNGSVKLITKRNFSVYEDSLTGAGGNDSISSTDYYNAGDVGVEDDITAHYSRTNHSKNKISGQNKVSNDTDIFEVAYSGNGYKLDISTKKIGSFTRINVDGSDSTKKVDNTTLSKYKFSNMNNDFSISITGGTIINTRDTVNYEDIKSVSNVALKGVELTTTDYLITTSKLLYTGSTLDATTYDMPTYHYILANMQGGMQGPIDKMQEDINQYFVPIILKNDNVVKIKNTEGVQIDAGAGKDTVIGAAGDDTIIGGAGSDKLTGGKGTDTFSFSNADFYTENAKGESVFNKSADTITDFNLKELDKLDFGDLGELSFYAKLADAKLDNAQLFYVKGSGSIYLNTSTTDGFTPTVIITLTGKPALNADGTDWNYPA